MQESASAIDSVNTIVNDAGVLKAYNTDYQAVVDVLKLHDVSTDKSVVIRGSGGMAKAVVAAFKDSGFSVVTVASRNPKTGQELASKYGFSWIPEQDLESAEPFDVLVNVTPIGMSGGNEGELSFTEDLVAKATLLFDVVAMPVETPLILAGLKQQKAIITGLEIMALQAAIQFELYTGIKLTDDQIKRAAAFSRL
jgi:shikimate dehydrogenase